MKRRIILTFMAVTTLLSVAAKEKNTQTVTVSPIAEVADAANNGVIYALPKTVVRVRVEAEVTIEKAGPYYNYSKRYLNLNNVITEDSESWKIVSAAIETYGKADISKRFSVGGSALPQISLTDDGRLQGVNFVASATECNVENSSAEIPNVDFDQTKLDRAVLSRTSTATMAEEVASSIFRIREKRLSLLGGDESITLSDGDSYRFVFNELDKSEKELIELFAGKRSVVRIVRYYEFTPDPQGANSTVLFRFSEKNGFLDYMNVAGTPVYADLIFSKKQPINEYAPQSKQRKQSPVTGLRYIVPNSINIKIVDRNILLVEKDILCAQTGQIVSLPNNALLNPEISIDIDTTTGALKQIDRK